MFQAERGISGVICLRCIRTCVLGEPARFLAGRPLLELEILQTDQFPLKDNIRVLLRGRGRPGRESVRSRG